MTSSDSINIINNAVIDPHNFINDFADCIKYKIILEIIHNVDSDQLSNIIEEIAFEN